MSRIMQPRRCIVPEDSFSSGPSAMYEWLGKTIVRRRGWFLALALTAAAASAATVPYLEFNFSPQQFFKTDTDLGEFRDDFAETFAREDNLLVVAVSGDEVFEPEVLGTLRNATLDIRRVEGISRAESVATFGLPRSGEEGSSLDVTPLLPQEIRRSQTGRAEPVDSVLAKRLETLSMQEPLVRGRLVSEERDAAALLVWIDRDVQAVSELRRVTENLQHRLGSHPLPDGYEYRTGGVPVLRTQIVQALQTEQTFFLPVTGGIFLIVLTLLFRRPSGVLLPLGVVVMAVASTVAVMVATDSGINVVNNVLPTVIFIIGIADSIHLLTRQAEIYDDCESVPEATGRMVATTGFACLMTSTTTAIGFLSLLYADTAILQNFGWQAAVGVMLAYSYSLLFLPAAASYLQPVRRRSSPDSRERMKPLERAVLGVADRILDHPWVAIAGSLSVCAVFGWFSTKVDVDAKLLEVFHRDHPSYETTEFLEQRFGGFLPMEVSLQADGQDRFRDPDVYRRLAAFQADASEVDEVLSSRSIVDFHQSARSAILNDPDARDEMPESRAEISQLHSYIAGAPDASTGPNQFITPDFQHARVLLRVGDIGAQRQLELADRLRERLDEHFGDVEGIETRITGDAYAASVALKSFILDLFYSLLFAGVVIFVLITLMFRSVRLGLVSVVPNLTPLLVTFGYMGWQGINLNSTTVIIFAIGLGLAVDDTIHVVARFREERHRRDTTREALVRTFFGAGRAIVLTSLLLGLGLAVLLFSDFIPTRRFGELTCITIGAAIVGDLVLLPALLAVVFDDASTDD